MFNSKIKKGLVALLTGTMVLGSLVIPTSAETAFKATGVFGDSTWKVGTWGAVAHKGDAEIKGDGTYTVTINMNDMEADNKVKDLTGQKSKDANVFCIDIPNYGKALKDAGKTYENCAKDESKGKYKYLDKSLKPDVTVSDVKVAVDGKDLKVDQSKVLWGDIEDKGNFRIEIANACGGTLNDGKSKDACIDASKVKFSKTLAVTFTLKGTDGVTANAASDTTAATTPAATTEATVAPTTAAPTTAAATTAPTTDSTKSTGEVSLAVVYGALIVCAGGLLLINLRKKQMH